MNSAYLELSIYNTQNDIFVDLSSNPTYNIVPLKDKMYSQHKRTFGKHLQYNSKFRE